MKAEKMINAICLAHSRQLELLRRKNKDYAGDRDALINFRRHGVFGVMVRLHDKICRVETLADGRTAAVKNESIRDTLDDIANYANLALCLLEEESSLTAEQEKIISQLKEKL